jgi:hypothetical protein
VKLKELPAEQLATRIAALEGKVKDAVPGKRVAYRQAARLKRFHATKVAPTKASGNAAAKGSGK